MGRSKKSFLERLVLEQEEEESVLEENLAFRWSEAAMLCEQWERRGKRAGHGLIGCIVSRREWGCGHQADRCRHRNVWTWGFGLLF